MALKESCGGGSYSGKLHKGVTLPKTVSEFLQWKSALWCLFHAQIQWSAFQREPVSVHLVLQQNHSRHIHTKHPTKSIPSTEIMIPLEREYSRFWIENVAGDSAAVPAPISGVAFINLSPKLCPNLELCDTNSAAKVLRLALHARTHMGSCVTDWGTEKH